MADVQLVSVDGIARKSGIDTEGLTWTEYTLEEWHTCDETEEKCKDGCIGHGDYCEECNAEIFAGWLCLDGGEVVCSKHVHYPK